MQIAQFVVIGFEILLTAVCALCALVSWRASKVALSRASTTSLRAELDEIRDAFERNSALLKRINTRTHMQRYRADADQPADTNAQLPGEDPAAWKKRVRAALIVPGRPVKHG